MSHDNNTNHSAAFLVSSFLMSKRSLKSVYNLNPTAIAILRYITDSMDLYYKKHQKRQTKLYQKQIATYSRCSLRSIITHINYLIRKRLLKYDNKKCIYSVGKVLTAYANIAYPIDICKSDVGHRYTQNMRTSYSSNITNKIASPKNEKPQASTESQSTSFVKDESFRKASPESVEEAWIKQPPGNRPTRYKHLPYKP